MNARWPRSLALALVALPALIAQPAPPPPVLAYQGRLALKAGLEALRAALPSRRSREVPGSSNPFAWPSFPPPSGLPRSP